MSLPNFPMVASGMLLVTKQLEETPSGGRQLLCRLNHDALQEIFGERFSVFELLPGPVGSPASFANACRGHIDGVTAGSIGGILRAVRDKSISQLFIDGSNLGEIARTVKAVFPQVRVCTFFHNVEARFFLGALRYTKSLKALAVLIANYLAERKSVRHSDRIICLSRRDSDQLRRIYGRAATNIMPMALKDRLVHAGALAVGSRGGEKYALFVGGGFYANRAGIAWFVKNVAPRVRMKVVIVGKGMEDLRGELEIPGKVELVGEVENLVPWYMNAHLVIAPIFDGSGMKTKVAEALMFGKRVIGTPEAFSGYEDALPLAGEICRDADEFHAALQRSLQDPFCVMDQQLRALYDRNYSYPAARRRLEDILAA